MSTTLRALQSLGAALVLVLAAFTAAASDTDTALDVVTLHSFGKIITAPGSSEPLFFPLSPGEHVPLKLGTMYSWFANVKPSGGKLRWQSELTLPAAPRSWGEARPGTVMTISPDRRSAVLEGFFDAREGQLRDWWVVAPGDPAGTYHLRVLIEGKLLRDDTFEVK